MSLVAVAWDWYARNRETLTAIGAMIGGGLLAWGALQQPAFAPRRLREQNDENRLPSVTEVFSKAVEHIGSNKVQVCLGGIYTLERISRESRHDYGAVMEILTAFVRYRARWNEPDVAPSSAQPQPQDGVADKKATWQKRPADVIAALTVIMRRKHADEEEENSRLDLRRTNLGGAPFAHAPLQRANLFAANLIDADLASANLFRANLGRANLRRANVVGAKLGRANLRAANLREANFRAADLSGATLSWADMRGVIAIRWC